MNRAQAQGAPEPMAALWQDGKSARPHEVRLFVRPGPGAGEIRICEADSPHGLRARAVWPLGRVRPVDGGPTGADKPLRLALEPDSGERLTVPPGPGREDLVRRLGLGRSAARRRALRRWGLVFVVAWAVGLGLYVFSPLIFSLAASAIPRPAEESLGRNARDTMVKTLLYMPGVSGINEAAGASPDLRALLARLEAGAPTDGYTFDLQVLDADFINAFALPGGYLVVSSGLVRDCASPDELAGVLAHEMAHVTARHGTAGVLRQHTWAVAARMMGLTDSLAGSLASTLLESSFSRDQERQADLLGARRLAGAGINPMAMADFFGSLAERGKPGSDKGNGESDSSDASLLRYLGSHPPPAERRDNIRRALEPDGRPDARAGARNAPQSAPATYAPALEAEAWQRLLALTPPSAKGDKGAKDAKDAKEGRGPDAPLPEAGPDAGSAHE